MQVSRVRPALPATQGSGCSPRETRFAREARTSPGLELAGSQRADADGVTSAEPSAHADKPARGLAAGDGFIANGGKRSVPPELAEEPSVS